MFFQSCELATPSHCPKKVSRSRCETDPTDGKKCDESGRLLVLLDVAVMWFDVARICISMHFLGKKGVIYIIPWKGVDHEAAKHSLTMGLKLASTFLNIKKWPGFYQQVEGTAPWKLSFGVMGLEWSGCMLTCR